MINVRDLLFITALAIWVWFAWDRSGPGPHDNEELREALTETSGPTGQDPDRWRLCDGPPDRGGRCGPWLAGPPPEGFLLRERD